MYLEQIRGVVMSKVFTVRLSDEIGKKLRIKAEMEHRSISEQIKKYLHDALLCEDNPDLPLSFIKGTIAAKKEMDAGIFEEYKFGENE
jgi:plasmid stability protein